MSKYNRRVIGFNGNSVEVDVYRVLDAFNVTNPALQHLVKKALAVGQRGHKDVRTDLVDILTSAEQALIFYDQKVRSDEMDERPQHTPEPRGDVSS